MTQLKQDFTAVKVDISYQEPAVVLVPRDDIARTTLQQILDHAPDSLVVRSGGIACDPEDSSTVIGAYLNFGGEAYDHTVRHPQSVTITTTEYRGAIKVHLNLTAVDPMVAGKIRSYLWYGTQVDPTSTADSLRLVPKMKCRVCSQQITRVSAMEWQTCNECATKCEHNYREMVGHYDGNVAWLPRCTMCGRADPAWMPGADPVVDMINTVTKGGLGALVLKSSDGSTAVITMK